MIALSALIKVHSRLSEYLAQGGRLAMPPAEAKLIVDELSSVIHDLRAVETHIQAALDVNDGLTMALLLMDAAHDQKLDADKLQCLLAPLVEKLTRTVEGMRERV